MKKRSIILIDFSEYSANLVKFAFDWSKQVDADLLFVHQTVLLTPVMSTHEDKEIIRQHTNGEALLKLKELSKDLLPSNAKISYWVSESHLQVTLDKLLAEPFDHLIFVGVKGTGLLKKIFIGSVAIQTIESTNNIIVAMPKGITKFSHENIFVAVAEKHPLNILALNNFFNFIDSKQTNITFFYLAKPLEKTQQIEKQLSGLAKLFADRFNTSFAIYERNDSLSGIKKVINNKIDELLIVQKGSRLLSDQLFRKFLINELVFEGQTPLIVLP